MEFKGLHPDYLVRVEAVAPHKKGGQHTGRMSSAVKVSVMNDCGFQDIVSVTVNARSQHKSREIASTLCELALDELGLLNHY